MLKNELVSFEMKRDKNMSLLVHVTATFYITSVPKSKITKIMSLLVHLTGTLSKFGNIKFKRKSNFTSE